MKISTDLLEELFLPFEGMADEVEHEFGGADPENKDLIIRALKTCILPHFQQYDEASQDLLKATLAYFLRDEKFNFQRFWGSLLAPFEAPDPGNVLLRWTWEVLFPGESWRDCHLDAVEDASVRSIVLYEKKQS